MHREWSEWIRGGPAEGLRRQHRFLRIPQGWAPVSVGRPRRLLDKEAAEAQERGDREFRLLLGALGDEEAPLGQQAEAEQQADEWAEHWGEGHSFDEWAVSRAAAMLQRGHGENRRQHNDDEQDDGQQMEPITVDELDKAASSFPDAAGLGWDAIHPKALLRLPHGLKKRFVDILNCAEKEGRWPKDASEVVVNLLIKPVGGYRPINLFPMMERIRRGRMGWVVEEPEEELDEMGWTEGVIRRPPGRVGASSTTRREMNASGLRGQAPSGV